MNRTQLWHTLRWIALGVAVLCVAGIVGILALTSPGRSRPVPTASATPSMVPPTSTETREALRLITVVSTATSTPTATETPSPTATATETPPPTPTRTETPQPTSTPQPTHTPTPTMTSQPTHTPMPTNTPRPTPTPGPTQPPTPVPPLSMEYVLVDKRCVSESRWMVEFWITAEGGNGTYTFYRDIERIHGPAPPSAYGYKLELGASSPAVGTLAVESGEQRAEKSFWVEHPNCSSY